MKALRTPDEIYGDLFELVQSTHVFPDSKTFVDATPKSDPAAVLIDFHRHAGDDGFDLRKFVEDNFELPCDQENGTVAASPPPVTERIEALWDELTREADRVAEHSSLIPLPRPYVVPGGRFREVFYWDSYFTMLGLAESGRVDAIEDMVDNFSFLVDEIGFIPNGNRSYFCTRSQPPYFVLMVELLAELRQDPAVLQKYAAQLEREYEFWMHGCEALDENRRSVRRVVAVEGGLLNRYWDHADTPRPEGYAEDIRLAERSDRDPASLYRDVRAACESGWDFCSRWFEDGLSMSTIRTTQILPVDLNSLLFRLETVLAKVAAQRGDDREAERFTGFAERRKRLLRTLFFERTSGDFVDLGFPDLKPTGVNSLAAAYPLFFGIATEDQAARVVSRIHADFLMPGGWVTTLNESGEQWDTPNGWAPLQWIVFEGMKNYGRDAEAEDGARRWVENNLAVYAESGRLLEKYNVVEVGAAPAGGEYPAQDGFGWSNAVLLKFMRKLGID